MRRMQAESAVRGIVASQTSQDAHPIVLAAATAAIIWYIAVVLVGGIGYTQLYVLHHERFGETSCTD